MSDRFTRQAEEILAICDRLGIDPAALGNIAGIKAETMRKYAKGYQKASDFVMQSLRNAEQVGVALRETSSLVAAKMEPSLSHAWMETSTLERALADLSIRLPKVSPNDRKHVLGNIRNILDELDQRELNSKPLINQRK